VRVTIPFDIFGGMTKGARILAVRNKLQLTQTAFAEMLGGVSRGAVGNWERDQGIKEENLELIADRTGVSYEWLATGRGDMDPSHNVAPIPRPAGLVRIPDLNLFGALGGGGLLEVISAVNDGMPTDPEQLRGYWTFPEYLVRAFRNVRGIYAWEVRGDSMEPTLWGGSVVFVDTGQTLLPPDDIYALDAGDGLVVKRLKLVPRTPLIDVISDNIDHYPTDRLRRDEVHVYGRIIGWFQWRH
jgi:phage repressor protein C with HTH and peptisase S24 domain